MRTRIQDVNQKREMVDLSDSKPSRTEGIFSSFRPLSSYTHSLGLEVTDFQDKRVLNVGSGWSRLGWELEQKGIRSSVVDLDLFDLSNSLFQDHPRWAWFAKRFVPSLVLPFFSVANKEAFVRGDARRLPFADLSFDLIVCHWMSYQIPNNVRLSVYKELIRVGEEVRLSPVEDAILDLYNLACEQDCQFLLYEDGVPITEHPERKQLDPKKEYGFGFRHLYTMRVKKM